MIKRFSDWEKINEVDELTEIVLLGKYLSRIIEAYRKYPDVKPSRDVKTYKNGAKSPSLADFMSSIPKDTPSSQILISVIDKWYKWPQSSKSRKVLVDYINNEDDLSNLTVSNVVMGMPGEIVTASGALKSLVKMFAKGSARAVTKSAAKSAAKAAESFDNRYSKSEELNEGAVAAVAGWIAVEAGLWALGTAINYTLYGNEEVESDILLSWSSPYIPQFKGVIGDNPLTMTYVATFNFAMGLIYDAWSLAMGQDKYGEQSNPILSWQRENNYITDFYNQYYDSSMKSGFTQFMNSLKDACIADSKNNQLFSSTPLYYVPPKMTVFFEDGKTQSIDIGEWQKWTRANYNNYYIKPRSENQFSAIRRLNGFTPLEKLGINSKVQGDPFREITIKWNNGQVSKSSLLQLESWLKESGKGDSYEIKSQDIVEGGSNIELDLKGEGDAKDQQAQTIAEAPPMEEKPMISSIRVGSTFDEIAINLQAQNIESFTGMGDV